jgi:hypothetical protein
MMVGFVDLIVSVPLLVTITILLDETLHQVMGQDHGLVATGCDEHTPAELVPVTSATAARGHQMM